MNLFGTTFLFLSALIGLILIPIYFKYKRNRINKWVEEQEVINKRTKTIVAKVVSVEKECKWGKNSYWVICEYVFDDEKYTFYSIPVKYALNLAIRQNIDVLVEPGNLSNYYVVLNDYINFTESNSEAIKIGKVYLCNEGIRGRSREKQIISSCVAILGVLIVLLLVFLSMKDVFSLIQIRVISLALLVIIFIIRKKVDW